MIVPYNEIAFSSIAFGKGGIMLDTVYGREFTIKGVKISQEIEAHNRHEKEGYLIKEKLEENASPINLRKIAPLNVALLGS